MNKEKITEIIGIVLFFIIVIGGSIALSQINYCKIFECYNISNCNEYECNNLKKNLTK